MSCKSENRLAVYIDDFGKLKKAKIVSSEHIVNVTGHKGINFLNDYDEAYEEELL